MPVTLRDYQAQAVADVREAFRQHRRVCFVLSTGGGKTAIASHITAAYHAAGRSAWFIAHRVELLDQISAALQRDGVPHGFIAAGGYVEARHLPVQVASIFTLARRLRRYRAPDLIIMDEFHHCSNGHNSWATVVRAFPQARVLGITATPLRLDGRGLDEHADVLVQGPSLADLTARGYLVPVRAFSLPGVDTSHLHSRGGEYVTKEADALVLRPAIVGDAVAHYARHAHGSRAIAFCPSVQSAREYAAAFQVAGIPSASIDGTMDRGLRRGLVRDFQRGTIKVLTSCDLISEGFDLPAVETAILLRPTQSLGLHRQQCLDDETEVLTKRGWLKRADIGMSDHVAAFDVSTGAAKWCPVLRKIERPLDENEEMYGVSGPHLNIRVTGGHDMVVRSRTTTGGWVKEWAMITAMRRAMFLVPVAGTMDEGDVGLSDDEIRLLGWYLTDGWIGKKNGVLTIAQSSAKESHCNEIRKVIRACGLKMRESRIKRKGDLAKYPDLMNFRVSRGLPRGTDKHLRGWGHLARWLDKSLPDVYWLMSPRQVGVLMEAINLGDGANADRTISWKRRTMVIACGDNRVLADRLQALLVMKGFRVNQSSYVPRDGRRTWYTLHVRPKRTASLPGIGITNGTMMGKKPYVRSRFLRLPSRQGEIVWCVENSLGTLFIRRKGKVCVVGNCGRALRPYEGKTHALILDHVGNIIRHGLPEQEPEWTLRGNMAAGNGKESAGPGVRVCPKCFGANKAGVAVCAYCHAAFPVKPREVATRAGELEELTPEQVARQRAVRESRMEQGRAGTLEALTELGRRRNMRRPDLWAQHVMAARAAKAAREAKDETLAQEMA